jgi:hypothetical protein
LIRDKDSFRGYGIVCTQPHAPSREGAIEPVDRHRCENIENSAVLMWGYPIM